METHKPELIIGYGPEDSCSACGEPVKKLEIRFFETEDVIMALCEEFVEHVRISHPNAMPTKQQTGATQAALKDY
jgi:hypothetical protein